MGPKGIIFDMDGTMVDNMMTHHRAWQVKLKSLGLDMPIEEIKEKVHGVNIEILERLFGDRFSLEERWQISNEKEEEYRRIFLENLKPVEGLIPFLDALQAANIPMAVGSAAPPENVEFVLNNLPLRPYLKGAFHAKSVTKGKPDPEIFEVAAASMEVALEDCLVFEDSITGAETALRAGCKAIILTTTHTAEEFQHFPHILKFTADFTDLDVELIRQLWGE